MRTVFLKVFFAFLFLLMLAPSMLWAEGDGCGAYTPTLIDVQPVFDDVNYEIRTPMLKIKELSAGTKDVGRVEQWPVGLSTNEMYFRVTTDIMKMRSGYGQLYCGQIKAIHVTFGFKNNTIYVAKEFPKRSCPFKTVLEHEEKHLKTDHDILDEYTEKSQSVLREAAEKIGVIRNGSPATVDDELNKKINEAIDMLSKEFEQEHELRQGKIDSPEEYKRVSESCDGRTMETVQQRLEILEESHPGITKVSHTPDDKTANP